MMKRILFVLTALIISCLSAAWAEEFVIHNGVHFGMTANEVQSLESTAGFNLELFDLETHVIHDWDQIYSLPFLALDRSDCSPWYFASGTIAGIENHAAVRYIFVNDTLAQAQYEFGWVKIDDAGMILSALLNKYGAPAASSFSCPDAFSDIGTLIPAEARGKSFARGDLPLPVTYANTDYSEMITYYLNDEDMKKEKYSISMGESNVDFYLTWVIGEGDETVVIDAAFISGHQYISGDHGSYNGLLVTYSRATPSSASWTDDL